KLNAGTVTPSQTSPVPALCGPISAALLPSSSRVLLPASTYLNRSSQHANHCFQDLAVRFCKVCGVLDETVGHSGQRQAFVSLGRWVCWIIHLAWTRVCYVARLSLSVFLAACVSLWAWFRSRHVGREHHSCLT